MVFHTSGPWKRPDYILGSFSETLNMREILGCFLQGSDGSADRASGRAVLDSRVLSGPDHTPFLAPDG